MQYIPVLPGRIPFFSVIICTYNRAELLPRAIESVLKQEEQDFEIIIVDDGSTDTTYSIAHTYCMADPRIRYMFHANKGTGLSRNTGILASSGLFITFLDSDDEYTADHLLLRRQALEQYPMLDLLHGGVQIIGDEFVADKDDPSRKIHLSECIIGGTFVLRRQSILDLGGFANLRYADDSELYQRAMEKGWISAIIDAPTYIYHRDTPDSLCTVQYTGAEQ
jgi:glycosyltransferase involved in cell wall biosynthesis